MDKIKLMYYKCPQDNWGDIVAKHIAEEYSKKESVLMPFVGSRDCGDVYAVTGSILQIIRSSNVIVWGLGFISENDSLTTKPKILSVRGPLTRGKLIEQGQNCPEIYGDPALLMSRIYKPLIKKKYKIGVIPHYVDKSNPWLNKFKNNKDIKIIDISNRASKERSYGFIDEVLECDLIISSSLHGIIVGDSYGIPSYWVEFSNKVVGKGFKFRDYFMSVKREEREPISIKEGVSMQSILDSVKSYEIDIDLDMLESCCPFKYEE
jgi:pyruvyltransferase